SVDRIIMRCLEKSPADRYQSALDAKHDIDEAYVKLGGDRSRRRPESVRTGDTVAKFPAPSVPVVMPSRSADAPASSMLETSEDGIETPSNRYDPEPNGAGEKNDLDTDFDMGSWHNERPQDAPR
ncbi:MAG: hypothetical protein ABI579_08005, partial [Candidatus Sumerlaeota bacterium]